MELSPAVPAVDRGRVGVMLFLATETMFFAGLLSALVVLAPAKSVELDLPLALAMTALLLASSLLLHLGLARRGGAPSMSLALSFGALLCGAGFLALMGHEWDALFAAGHRPSADLWQACFFVLTGVHGLHVLGGVAWLACGWTAQARGGTGRALELGAMYWHFVDAVWLVLLWMLYLS